MKIIQKQTFTGVIKTLAKFTEKLFRRSPFNNYNLIKSDPYMSILVLLFFLFQNSFLHNLPTTFCLIFS